MSAKKQRPSKGGILPDHPSVRDLAAFTGMSTRQIWQAKKIAEIPAEEFDRLVESDEPPTVTELLRVAHQRDTLRADRCDSQPGPKRSDDRCLIGWAVTHAPTVTAYERHTGESIAPAINRYLHWCRENLIGEQS